MKKELFQLAFVSIFHFHSWDAFANGNAKPSITLEGFGTVGAVHFSSRQTDYVQGYFQPNGAGFTRSWSTNVDSKLGLQVATELTDQITALLQVISEQRWDNSYKPAIELANIKYTFTPDFNIRVGRIMLSNFLFFDSRKVGYALPWVRTPSIYNQSPISNINGFDVSYRRHLNDLANTTVVQYGRRDVKQIDGTEDGNTLEGRHIFGITNTSEYGFWTLQFSHLSHQYSLKKIADQYPSLASFVTGIKRELSSIGIRYDTGKWFFIAEASKASTQWAVDESGWYASAGYRVGDFIPYISYSIERKRSPEDALFIAAPDKQKTAVAGVRWDFIKNVDLKFQYNFIQLGDGQSSELTNVQPGFKPGSKAHVFSMAVDFLF